MISLANSFVFVHIPKTGGNSLQRVLEPYSDDRRQPTQGAHDLDNRFELRGPITGAKHFTSRQYIDIIGIHQFLGLRKVTIVRNPFDRAMSLFFATSAEPDFSRDAFLRRIAGMRTASSFLSYQSRLISFDYIGRFERFAEDSIDLMRACGITEPGEIPHVNRGPVAATRQFYDSATADAVRRRFHVDFVQFGYSTEI